MLPEKKVLLLLLAFLVKSLLLFCSAPPNLTILGPPLPSPPLSSVYTY